MALAMPKNAAHSVSITPFLPFCLLITLWFLCLPFPLLSSPFLDASLLPRRTYCSGLLSQLIVAERDKEDIPEFASGSEIVRLPLLGQKNKE